MRDGRFHPPKCRSKFQKMGALHTHSPQILGPSSNTRKISLKRIAKIAKKRRR
jgi:hypothetical protein